MWFLHTGIGRIYANLLRGLLDTAEIDRVFTVVQRSRKREFEDRFQSSKIQAQFVDYPFDYREMLFKGFAIRRFRPTPDVYYFPSFNVPFFLRGKIVGTVCDLIPMSPFFPLPWHVRERFRIAIAHAIRASVSMVAISEFTKSQMVEEFGVTPDRIDVIYPPLRLPDDGEVAAARSRPPLVEGEYLLYVGNRHVHKNVPCLLEAFRLLRHDRPGLRVVVAGARMHPVDEVDTMRNAPEMREAVVEFMEASDDEIWNLHAHARVFVFPTRIEGFGIPPLEALSFGVPVVASDIPVIREVCADTVRYADPGDPKDFAGKIADALRQVPAEEAVRRGMERARRYATKGSIALYLELFRRTARGGR